MSKRKHAIEAYFQSGVRLQGAGRLAEAEQVYRQILAVTPDHADSLHMLGVIASQCGQPQAALACIDPGDEVIVPDPGYFHFVPALRLAGGVPVWVRLGAANGWRLDPDEVTAGEVLRARVAEGEFSVRVDA